jgi:guanylate kinase
MIILTGASASGKTEVAHSLARHYGIIKAVTTTSRLPRTGEVNGVDYYFVTESKFKELLQENSFVEHTLYNGNFYGTGKSEVNDSKCLVVDPKGLASFISFNDPSVVSFLLIAQESTREERMKLRGDNPLDIQKRIATDRIDFDADKIPYSDFKIVTDSRSIDEIAEDIFEKYQATLRRRGLIHN